MKLKLSKRDLSKIFIIVISAILIINLQVPVFALTEGPAEVNIQTLSGEQTITPILPEIPAYTTKFIYRDKRFEEVAEQDASIVYAYRPTDSSKITVWVTMEIAKTRSSLHRWEVCLITWPLAHGRQPRVTQLSLGDVQLLQNPPITARYFAFQDAKSNITQVVLYWYENAFFKTGSSQEQEHIKISLIAFAKNPEDISNIEEYLLPFGKTIASYWQPIKTWSQIALTISQNGSTLIATTTILLTILLAYQAIQNWKNKKSNLKMYQKIASEEEKLTLKAVYQASQQGKPTINTIAKTYQKLTGKQLPIKTAHQKLEQAQKAGLIEKEITSFEDKPILTWKIQISL